MQRRRRELAFREVSRAAPSFAALGDRTRLGIVLRLCLSGPQSTARLTRDTNISRQAVTKHLTTLEQAQIVGSSRAGRERVWVLRQDRLEDLDGYIRQISAQWDAVVSRLREMVER